MPLAICQTMWKMSDPRPLSSFFPLVLAKHASPSLIVSKRRNSVSKALCTPYLHSYHTTACMEEDFLCVPKSQGWSLAWEGLSTPWESASGVQVSSTQQALQSALFHSAKMGNKGRKRSAILHCLRYSKMDGLNNVCIPIKKGTCPLGQNKVSGAGFWR